MYISIIYDHAIYSVVQCSIMHMTLHFSIPRVLRLRCACRRWAWMDGTKAS